MRPEARRPALLPCCSKAESLSPSDARRKLGGMQAVGDGLRWLHSDDPRAAPAGALPNAADLVLLPTDLTSLPPRPIYGRAPDAKPMAPEKAGA